MTPTKFEEEKHTLGFTNSVYLALYSVVAAEKKHFNINCWKTDTQKNKATQIWTPLEAGVVKKKSQHYIDMYGDTHVITRMHQKRNMKKHTCYNI